MEGGRPEDVSLLSSGGAEPTIIPVQGGGGGGPLSGGGPPQGYNPEVSLLETGGNQSLVPVQGGGNLSGDPLSGGSILGWLAGTSPLETSAQSQPDPTDPVTAAYDQLSIPKKIVAVSSAVASAARIKSEGLPGDQAASKFVQEVTGNINNSLAEQNGRTGIVLDPAAQDLLDYGTKAEHDAIRKVIAANPGADQKTLSQKITDAVVEERTKYAKTDEYKTLASTKPFKMTERAIMKHESKRDSFVYRSEYIVKPLAEANLKTAAATKWVQSILARTIEVSAKKEIIEKYIESQTLNAWLDVKPETHGRVCSLPDTIENIVHIPSLYDLANGEVEGMELVIVYVLEELHKLNILVFNEEGINITCRANKRVAIAFSNFIHGAQEESFQTYMSLFIILISLMADNSDNIYLLAAHDEPNNRFGQLLLQNLSIPADKNPNPLALSAAHVIYPYTLKNNINGILITSEDDANVKLVEQNVYRDIYADAKYGAPLNVFVKGPYPFVRFNKNILAYRSLSRDNQYSKDHTIVGYNQKTDVPLDIETIGDFGEAFHDGPVNRAIEKIFELFNGSYYAQGSILRKIFDILKGHKYYASRSEFILDYEVIDAIYSNEADLVAFSSEVKYTNIADTIASYVDYISYYVHVIKKSLKSSSKSMRAEYNSYVGRSGEYSKFADANIDNDVFKNYEAALNALVAKILGLGVGEIAPFLTKIQGAFAELKGYVSSGKTVLDVPPSPTADVISEALNPVIDQYIMSHRARYLRYPLTKEYTYRAALLKGPVQGGGAKKGAKNGTKKGVKKGTKKSKQTGGAAATECAPYMDPSRPPVILGKFDLEQYNPARITMFTISSNPQLESVCLDTPHPFSETSGQAFAEWPRKTEISNAADIHIIRVGKNAYTIRRSTDERTRRNWAGKVVSEADDNPIRKLGPILIKEEAALLNDLNLTPINMTTIFSGSNPILRKHPQLQKWHMAIPIFFENVTHKCYDNRLLLTTSQCELTKYFLYAIRDYLEKHPAEIKRPAEVEGVDPALFDKGEDIAKADGIELNKMPSIKTNYVLDERRPAVNAVAINEKTGHKTYFSVKLDEQLPVGQDEVPAEEKRKLEAKILDLQAKYKNYVIYPY
jgi:hypothetical protein